MPFTRIDPQYKVTETDTHLFFVNGPFSQWFMRDFTAEFDGEIRTFNCCEQYMMARKAGLFGDSETLSQIMQAITPKAQKTLGRQVRDFEVERWSATAREIVFQGNLAKFSQHDDLCDYMMATGDKILVEGAHYDPVWGVGLAWNDPLIVDPANWKGTNWLGEALMQVRGVLLAA